MKLSALLTCVPARTIGISSDPDISSVHYRSQEVKPGGIFIAVRGFSTDGHNYIEDAVARGAVAVVVDRPVRSSAVIVEVENTRKAMASISSAFYGHPSGTLYIIGVTGTNGKTTAAFLIEGILTEAGFPTGVIGTINYRYCGKTYSSSVTTPESLDLQQILSDMKASGVTHVVMEVSSHGIDLLRVYDCGFDAAVFTNLSQDHLDFHKNMETYWSCKKRFFTDVLMTGDKRGKAFAVVNAEDPRGKELLGVLSIPVISTGLSPKETVRADQVRFGVDGIQGSIITPEGAFDFQSPLIGRHNLENILSAAGVGIGLGLPVASIKKGIEKVSLIPGRLQAVENHTGRHVYVDYAHTPAALEKVLNALGSMAEGRMICVFGCGGDRDKGKRPIMGEIAASLCDLAVVTSDNPRTEPPMAIIAQILEGIKKTGLRAFESFELSNGLKERGYVVEPDRTRAIRLGIRVSRPGDVVLIAGKGHETYQIIGKKNLTFDDRVEAAYALSRLFRGGR